MAKQIYRILDDLSPSEAKLRNLPRKLLYNMNINEYGQLEKRAGYAKYNTNSIGASHKITGMHRFYKMATSSKEFLVNWNTSLYKLPDTGDHDAVALTNCPTLTADQDTYFADFYNHCYIVNGSNTMMKYNMTNVRTVGIAPPDGNYLIFNSNIDGSLTPGIYYYRLTFVDEDGYESNGSVIWGTGLALAHPNDGNKMNIPTSTDTKIAKRRIYRTTAGGVVFYYEGEVADNSTETYNSTIADATIALNSVLHTDHDAPPSDPHLITKRRNRLYLGHDSELCISHLSDREYFPAAWFIYTGSRQKIRGLIEARADLAILTDDTLERLVNYDEDNFEMIPTFSTEGCIAQRSLVNCDNLIFYLGFDGIYYFDGVATRKLNNPLNKYIKDNIVDACAYLSCGTFFDDKYILCYPKTGGTYPTETVYYDSVNGNYGIYSFAFSCFSKWDKGSDGLQLKGGSNTIGQIYSVFSGLDDDGSAITAYDKPSPIDMGKPEVYKQFYSIFIKIKSTTATTLTMNYSLDNATEVTSQTKTIEANKTKWYRVGLGEGGIRGRSIQPRPLISDKYYFEIHGYLISYEDEPFVEEIE